MKTSPGEKEGGRVNTNESGDSKIQATFVYSDPNSPVPAPLIGVTSVKIQNTKAQQGKQNANSNLQKQQHTESIAAAQGEKLQWKLETDQPVILNSNRESTVNQDQDHPMYNLNPASRQQFQQKLSLGRSQNRSYQEILKPGIRLNTRDVAQPGD